MGPHQRRDAAHHRDHDTLRTIHNYRLLTAGKLAADDRRDRANAEASRWRALKEAGLIAPDAGVVSAVRRVARAGVTRVGLPQRVWVCGTRSAMAATSLPSTG
jgi:hypothetical protein